MEGSAQPLTGEVSTHAPTRGATQLSAFMRYLCKFQPTRPRGARHCDHTTHSLQHVSTHAPTRGATVDVAVVTPANVCFNPRAHEGRDWAVMSACWYWDVSTHAPTRGATALYKGACERQSFNPRAHEGRDIVIDTDEASSKFQPTRPRGARLCRHSSKQSLTSFQPTRPRGARHMFCMLVTFCVLFQPTRPRGARLGDGWEYRNEKGVSTHAPTRGATALLISSMMSLKFQPTRPRGARLEVGADGFVTLSVSTHAPTRGATEALTSVAPCKSFQPTRPRGARRFL